MKRIALCLFSLLVLLGSLMPLSAVAAEPEDPREPILSDKTNVDREHALSIPDSGVTDNLDKEEDERWYRFTVSTPGDALLRFDVDGVVYNRYSWEYVVYDEDLSATLAADAVGKGKTYIPLQDLESGTYWVHVRRTYETDPPGQINIYGFSSTPYTLRLLTPDSPKLLEDANGVHMARWDFSLLCVVDGTLFVKNGDGEALVALYTDLEGKTGPILVSQKADYVQYYSTEKKAIFEKGESLDLGITYFFPTNRGLTEKSGTDSATPPLYVCAEGEPTEARNAAREVFNVSEGLDPYDGLALDRFAERVLVPYAPYIIVGLVIVITSIILAAKYFTEKHSYRYSGSSSGGDSFSSSSS
ncbi:MAG: hypothetical protein IKC69_01900, partial [Clostridia bacterium]|nr:hypothetical protein [Clostridia bacterium]